MDIDSASVVPGLLTSLAWLLLPGLLLVSLISSSRLGWLGRAALAAPVSVAIIGVSATVGQLMGVPFDWRSPVSLTLVLLAPVVVSRARRTRVPFDAGQPRPRWDIAPLLGATVGGGLTGWIAFRSLPTLDLPNQTFDGVFHLNAVASILTTGQGSAFTLYRITHPGDGIEFYPAGWHDIAALVVQATGASIPMAFAATWMAACGVGATLGVAYLTTVLVARHRATAATVAAVTFPFVAIGPYLLLEWGTLYPTALAYSLLPVGLAIALNIARARSLRASVPWLIAMLAWGVAELFAHPRSLFTFAVFLSALALTFAFSRVRRPLLDRATRRRTLVTLGASAIAISVMGAAALVAALRYFGADSRPISDRLNGGPALARQTLGESAAQVLGMVPPIPTVTYSPGSLVLAALVFAGLVLAFRHRDTRWIAIAYIAMAILYCLAAGSNSDLAKVLTGAWYKDKFRLLAPVGMIAPVLVGVSASALRTSSERLSTGARRTLLALAAASGSAVLVALLSGSTLSAVSNDVARVHQPAVGDKGGLLLNADELDLLRRLPEWVPPGELVIGNPWNGSALTWAVGGRESVFPHFVGEWGADRDLIAASLDQAAISPEVCPALQRIGARYLMSSSGLLWGGDPQAVRYEAIDRAAEAPGFTEVARSGSSALYEITACD